MESVFAFSCQSWHKLPTRRAKPAAQSYSPTFPQMENMFRQHKWEDASERNEAASIVAASLMYGLLERPLFDGTNELSMWGSNGWKGVESGRHRRVSGQGEENQSVSRAERPLESMCTLRKLVSIQLPVRYLNLWRIRPNDIIFQDNVAIEPGL